MQGIPERAIKVAARRLRARLTAMDDARAALADAISDAGDLPDPLANTDGGSRGGRITDRTAQSADRILAARERLERAEAWEAVFAEVDRDFPPDSPEGRVRDLCLTAFRKEGERFGRPCMTMAEMARAENLDRQTIKRRKEIILGRVAYYAAEAGLVRKETDNDTL